MGFQVNPIIFRKPINKKWSYNNVPNFEKFNSLNITLNSFITNYLRKKNIYTGQQKTLIDIHENKINIYIYYFTFNTPKNIKYKIKNTYIINHLKKLLSIYKKKPKIQKKLKNKVLSSFKIYNSLKERKIKTFDRLIRWQLQDEVYKYFKAHNVQIYIKNVLRLVKPIAYIQEKKFFNEYFKRFKGFRFYRRLLHIINIGTHLKNTKILSEFLIHGLCYKHLKKQWKFIHTAVFFLEKFLYARPSIRGIKISIAGKINGSLRKKTFIKILGSMPLHTLITDIRYTENFRFSPRYGAFCLKLWFYI